MIAVPATSPLTTPDAEPTDTPPLASHTPPWAVSDKVVLAPVHSVVAPDIEPAFGEALMVSL